MIVLRLVCVQFESATREGDFSPIVGCIPNNRFILSPCRVTSREALALASGEKSSVLALNNIGGGLVMCQQTGYSFSSEGIKSVTVRYRRTKFGSKRIWSYKDMPDNEESRTKLIKLMDRGRRYNTYIPDDNTLVRILIDRASRLEIIISDPLLTTLLDTQLAGYKYLREKMRS